MASIFFTPDYRPAVQLHPGPVAGCVVLDLTALPAGSYQVRLLDQAGHAAPAQLLAGGNTYCLSLRDVAGPSYGVLVSRGSNAGFILLNDRLPTAGPPRRVAALHF